MENIKDLKTLAKNMDSRFQVGPFRVGYDGLIGLIPVVGDFLTLGPAFYILLRGYLLGCSNSILIRMLGNLLIDTLFSAIPLVGNIFDFGWKANNRNVRLIEQALENPKRTRQQSKILIGLFIIGFFILFLGVLWVSYRILLWLSAELL